jgi:ABC-2 type transport system permease protein
VNSPIEFAVIMVLVAAFSAAGGLALRCTMNQQHIGLMFSMVITPMIFFGCTYYRWSALNTFPILQKVVLLIRWSMPAKVCGARWCRSTRTYQQVLSALSVFDLLLLIAGLRQFQKKSES